MDVEATLDIGRMAGILVQRNVFGSVLVEGALRVRNAVLLPLTKRVAILLMMMARLRKRQKLLDLNVL
jgi:hypothetical protein